MKQVQLDETLVAATSRLEADLQHAAKSEESARNLLAEEVGARAARISSIGQSGLHLLPAIISRVLSRSG